MQIASIKWNFELTVFELTVFFNIEKIGAVFKTWLKLRIKWNFELTVFDLAVPDL